MKVQFGWVLAFLLSHSALSPFQQAGDGEWLVRVGLERQASGRQIFIQAQGGTFRWVDIDTGRTVGESPPDTLWRIIPEGEELLAEPLSLPTKPSSPQPPSPCGRRGSIISPLPLGEGQGVRATLPKGQGVKAKRLRAEPIGDAQLAVGTEPTRLKPFRGAMEWRGQSDRLLTINWVRLDDYLKAVLPLEISPRFHPDALKAQAVAARSFTFRRLNRHRTAGYDLCDTEHCQLYGGILGEHPTTSTAVEATAGEVLWHNGRIFEALYCGNCGGHTAPNEQVGVGTIPLEPLRGTPDWDEQTGRYYCEIAPNVRWNLTLTPEALQRAFPKVGRPKSLRILERAPSGHVVRLQLEGDRATLTIAGARFRQQLGATRVRSLMFTLEPDGEGWRLAGRGSGHGAGLCQWGAQGRALAGQPYHAILQAYYPTTTIAPLQTTKEKEPWREGHQGSAEREGGAQDTSRANR